MNNLSEKQIAIIGQENVISCFKFVGFKTYFANNAQQCLLFLDEIKTNYDNFAIIYITENFYDELQEELSILSQKISIPITIIPDNTGSKNKALDMLSYIVEQATGSDILSKS